MASGTVALRRLALNAFYLSHAHRAMARFTRGVGAVLTFHRVRHERPGGFRPNRQMEVTPEFLAAVIDRLRLDGIDIVSMDEARRRIADPKSKRFCVIALEDGYRDTFEVAYPVLKKLGCPFAVYVATGFMDRTAVPPWLVVERIVAQQKVVALAVEGPLVYYPSRSAGQKLSAVTQILKLFEEIDEDRQRTIVRELAWKYGFDIRAFLGEEMMSWEQLRELAADPLVTVGSHTVGHFALSRLPLSRARAEMRDGAKVLEAALGKAPRHFAYPYGDPSAVGEREIRLAEDLGFATALTARPGVLKHGHSAATTAWPSVPMSGHFQSLRYLDLFLSGAPQALQNTFRRPAWPSAPAPGIKAAASNG